MFNLLNEILFRNIFTFGVRFDPHILVEREPGAQSLYFRGTWRWYHEVPAVRSWNVGFIKYFLNFADYSNVVIKLINDAPSVKVDGL